MDQDNKPQYILYVSCFLNSLIQDLTRLVQYDYKVKSIVGVDQFPQSSHCEWVVLLKVE